MYQWWTPFYEGEEWAVENIEVETIGKSEDIKQGSRVHYPGKKYDCFEFVVEA
jgi:hypothetical protein